MLSAIELRVEGDDPERGATSIEYALMASLIAVVIIGAVTLFGEAVAGLLQVPASVF